MQHHCLSHVLSTANQGTASGELEVWGGPLSGGDFVLAAVNRGAAPASIALNWTMLEVSGVTSRTAFDVRELWSKTDVYKAKIGGFLSANVPSHDLRIYRLSTPKLQQPDADKE